MKFFKKGIFKFVLSNIKYNLLFLKAYPTLLFKKIMNEIGLNQFSIQSIPNLYNFNFELD